ncbi:MAG: hypothetical protein AVDCRST_MAG72-63 [uncultured Nocardioidaceae bacterium]|uniref:Uncharacterized protein n=1 Tax=uncultured Nocardioidaceae bacterium TaxID=253824 RepID=A0A6J4LEV7_9ACTN|nr:MAG: hypothetical protein AVDCRST_MAG72-63 [uncultured Nocardioidaceae bacterium]
MPISSHGEAHHLPPGWALEQAAEEQGDNPDLTSITDRAWELAHQAQERESERHDEYDDPDEGGEG